MSYSIVKGYKYNFVKGVVLLLYAFMMYRDNYISYLDFSGLSVIVSGMVYLVLGIVNSEDSIENKYLLVYGIVSLTASLFIMIFLSSKMPYYSNRVMFSFWLLSETIYTASYIMFLPENDKNLFSAFIGLVIGFMILVFLTLKAFLDDLQSFTVTFAMLPFTVAGLFNLYVCYAFRKYKRILEGK